MRCLSREFIGVKVLQKAVGLQLAEQLRGLSLDMLGKAEWVSCFDMRTVRGLPAQM